MWLMVMVCVCGRVGGSFHGYGRNGWGGGGELEGEEINILCTLCSEEFYNALCNTIATCLSSSLLPWLIKISDSNSYY